VEHAHPALAHVLLVVLAHQLVENLVVVLVVAEHHVPADVPRETGGVGKAARQATNVWRALIHLEVIEAELFESIRFAQARGASADDDELLFGHPWYSCYKSKISNSQRLRLPITIRALPETRIAIARS